MITLLNPVMDSRDGTLPLGLVVTGAYMMLR